MTYLIPHICVSSAPNAQASRQARPYVARCSGMQGVSLHLLQYSISPLPGRYDLTAALAGSGMAGPCCCAATGEGIYRRAPGDAACFTSGSQYFLKRILTRMLRRTLQLSSLTAARCPQAYPCRCPPHPIQHARRCHTCRSGRRWPGPLAVHVDAHVPGGACEAAKGVNTTCTLVHACVGSCPGSFSHPLPPTKLLRRWLAQPTWQAMRPFQPTRRRVPFDHPAAVPLMPPPLLLPLLLPPLLLLLLHVPPCLRRCWCAHTTRPTPGASLTL
eukprot:358521-Chlamydomonas_euryale.AAC.12